MRQLIVIISAVFILCPATSFAGPAEFCSREKIVLSLDGVWKSDDTYLLKIQTRKHGQVCFSIDDNGDKIERNIRDVVIIDGKLRHFAYYTPSTDGYVAYVNIKADKDKISYEWYSSYELKSGKDVYTRRKPVVKSLSKQEARYQRTSPVLLKPQQ